MVEYTKQNFWFNKPLLCRDERLLFEIPANRSQGRRAVGGKLFGTEKRIVFVPNRLDALLGGTAAEIPVAAVAAVTDSTPRYTISEVFSGAFRSRLSIRTNDHQIHLFVVEQLRERIELVRNHVPC